MRKRTSLTITVGAAILLAGGTSSVASNTAMVSWPANSTALSSHIASNSVPYVPSITLPPLPSEFHDIPQQSLACYDAWASANARNALIQAQVSSLASPVTLTNYTTTSVRSDDYDDCHTLPYTRPYITLCDGLPRNPEARENITCSRKSDIITFTWSADRTVTRSIPTWLSSWSASNAAPLPNCTPAPDRENLCYRLHSAYSWRTSDAKATLTANATDTPEYVFSAEKPTCQTLHQTPPASLTTKSCYFEANNYEVYYWPSAPLTGSSFCANITRSPGGTRTIPWLPNTAIVSGLTLTSPSVYHFLKGVAVSTSIGETWRGRAGYSPVYNISSSIPETIITLPQDESDVWTAQPTHKGVGLHAHWDWRFANGSYNADAMATAKSAAYFNACIRERTFDCATGSRTISQAQFRQYAALSIKDVLNEWDSDEFQDCVWHQYWERGPWYDREDMWIAPGEPWRATPIVTDEESVPEATRMHWASPGSTLDEIAIETARDLLPTL